jgi:diguanylate cyclase (GGDEF)-like protein
MRQRETMTKGFASLDNKNATRGSPIRGLLFGGLFLITAIMVGTTIMAGMFRERALNDAKRELENTVLLLARHFDQQFRDLGAIQQDVAAFVKSAGIDTSEGFRQGMSGADVHAMLKARIGALSYVGGVTLFDAEGRLINSSSVWPIPAVDVADRHYFRAFKTDPRSPDVLVEPVHSRITGAWTTLVVRKLTGRNGEFLGIVGRGFEPANFEKFFASIALGADASISMIHCDGTLLARYPHDDSLIGRNFRNGPMFRRAIGQTAPAAGIYVNPADGEERLGAAYGLAAVPILVLASTTVTAALAGWREQMGFLVGVGLGSVSLIAAMLFLAVRRLSRDYRFSEERLTLEKQRLDRAINHMTQGLLLFDSSQRLVICNHRYIEMYGLSVDVVKPGCSFRDVIAHRKATGSFLGDVDDYVASILRDIGQKKSIVIETSDGRFIHIVNEPLADGGWVATHEDITDRRLAEQRITRLAHYDALTGLPNRTLFHQWLTQELADILPGQHVAVLYIDIDEFKSVNDTLGHQIGDELLKSVALTLSECVGAGGFVARLGGDEFAIVQTAVKSTDEVTDLVARVFDSIRAPFDCLGHQLASDASIGIALAPQHGVDLDRILRNADLAMYAAKSAGRRTHRFFEAEMDAKAKARRQLESDLRHAISAGALEVHYQPCISLRDDTITGCEALVRWRHPKRGIISPAEFIPIAEDTGLINQLGEWVLNTACADAAKWPDDIRLAVNVSPVQFKSGTFALKVMTALAASELPANRLELEITEAVLIRDDEAALDILHQLRDIGVRIALDDFGTGYSSLSYLQRFPFDKIKIDRSFVNDVADPDGSSSIVQAVVGLATAKNMETTAEGVETETQRQLLRTLGCTEMQGYLFSAAKPIAEIEHLFSSGYERATAIALVR